MSSLIILAVIIALAWGYDFFNGANDCANSIATTVSTRALSPRHAVLLASSLNLLGAFLTTKVAETIGKRVVRPEAITQDLLVAALVGAIVWTALCSRWGLPISVTHALVGGLAGAAIIAGGFRLVQWEVVKYKIILAMFLAPALGFLIGLVLIRLIFWAFRRFQPKKVNDLFRKGQVLSASFMALAHGMNDTQNAMGIITAALVAGGFVSTFRVPWWVILGSGFFMGLGTYSAGWRVMKTLGRKVAKIRPVHGFSAETASAAVIGLNSLAGMPISTSQVISSAVIGVASGRVSAVKWNVARRIVVAWIITFPAAGLLAALTFLLLERFF